jgi:hypothetical protein
MYEYVYIYVYVYVYLGSAGFASAKVFFYHFYNR